MTGPKPSDDGFYRIPTSEQLLRLERMAEKALAHWNAQGSKISPIKYRENAVFAIQRPDGERSVLRIHRPGYRSDQHVRSEYIWMGALAGHGLPTPAPIPTVDGEPFAYVVVDGIPEARRCDVLSWIDGAPFGSVEHGASGAVETKARNYYTLGEFAARLHSFGASWSPPSDFALPAWNADSLVGEDPEWGRFWELDCLSDAQRSRIIETRDRVRQRLLDFGEAPDRYGLLHGDFLPENILVADDCAYLIDFNDAGSGWFLFEFATSLFFLQLDPDFETICKALTAGYRSVRAMPAEYEQMMPTMMMARGLSYLGWPVSRPEIDEARAFAPLLAELVIDLCNRYLADELRIPG